MNKIVKIFEIKGDDWARGLSRQTSSTLGGLFTLANGFDPFRKNGVYQPGMANNALSSVNGAAASFLTPFALSGVGYFYAHGPTKLYKVNVTDNTVTDETANVTTGAALGAGIWRNKYVYSLATEVRKIELGAGTDTSLLTGLTSGVPHIMATGADLFQYITNGNLIAKLILETGTAGNTLNAFTLETGMVAKDIGNDGRYLVIAADNNSSDQFQVKSKCVIMFWDMYKATADYIYTVNDTKIIAMEIIGSTVYLIGYENIYVCSAGNPPQIIYSFTGNATITARPSGSSTVTQKNGILYWVGATNNRVYAYGNPLDPTKKIFYNPYFLDTGTESTALLAGISKFFVATNTPGIVEVETGTGTAAISLMSIAPISFGQRYEFAYAKIVLRGRLASDEGIDLKSINSEDGNNVITTVDSRTFAGVGSQSVFTFYRTPGTNSIPEFEELSSIQIEVRRRAVVSFEIYATPLENQYQNL